uniref:Replication protein n=1 Tax=uncultured prokaryote TaxID=198431 RepID=A0A0H5PZI7_9ZZZZ|nr:hypothetical protein [uncultured prokaryote]
MTVYHMSTSKSSGNKTRRTRTYTCIVYPDSAPDNWRDIIDGYHIEWAASPLHDRDINADGSAKKPHWHVLLCWDSVKTPEQAGEVAQAVNGTIVQPVQSVRALLRYMCHLDNPDKAQYDKAMLETHGGLDASSALRTADVAVSVLVRDMLSWCRDNGVTELCDLMDYAAECEPDWWDALLHSCAYVVGQYLKSRRYKLEMQALQGGRTDE